MPVSQNIPGDEMPIYRDLWKHISKDMPKEARGSGRDLDPLKLPTRLRTALDALYGHFGPRMRALLDLLALLALLLFVGALLERSWDVAATSIADERAR